MNCYCFFFLILIFVEKWHYWFLILVANFIRYREEIRNEKKPEREIDQSKIVLTIITGFFLVPNLKIEESDSIRVRISWKKHLKISISFLFHRDRDRFCVDLSSTFPSSPPSPLSPPFGAILSWMACVFPVSINTLQKYNSTQSNR